MLTWGLHTASACQDKIIIVDNWGTSIFDTKSFTCRIVLSMSIKCFVCSSVFIGKHTIVAEGIEQSYRKNHLHQTQVFDH